MAVKPSDFFAFAAPLCESADEIDLRNAISRSYYGALLHARERIDRKVGNGHVRHARGTHAQVIGCYEKGPTEEHKVIAYMLQDYKRQREEADYDIDEAIIGQKDAKQLHKSCLKLTGRIDTLPNIVIAEPPVPHPVAAPDGSRPRLTIIK